MGKNRFKDLVHYLSVREGRNLTNREVAGLIGRSEKTIYEWTDDELFSPNNLMKVAKALPVNELDLLVAFGVISEQTVAEHASQAGGSRPRKPANVTSLADRRPVPPPPALDDIGVAASRREKQAERESAEHDDH